MTTPPPSVRLPLLLLGFLISGALASANVISGDAVLTATPGGAFGDYELTLEASIPDGEGLFGIGISETTLNEFTFGTFAIAETYALYLGGPMTVFDPLQASATPPIAANDGSPITSPTTTIGAGSTQFFTYWDDRDFDSMPTPGDNYGWVQLRNGVTGLELVGGATAIGSAILVGTTTAVPEPSAAALAILGLGLSVWPPRRRS